MFNQWTRENMLNNTNQESNLYHQLPGILFTKILSTKEIVKWEIDWNRAIQLVFVYMMVMSHYITTIWHDSRKHCWNHHINTLRECNVCWDLGIVRDGFETFVLSIQFLVKCFQIVPYLTEKTPSSLARSSSHEQFRAIPCYRHNPGLFEWLRKK